jgi:hypothetical protein
MNDLKLKVYDKIDNKIFAVAAIFFNNDGVKTVQIYGKASPKPRPGMNPNSLSAPVPINRLNRERIELLMPTLQNDKNGNMIYMADVIHIAGQNAVVKMKDGTYYWESYDTTGELDDCSEILGSYLTNPELMEGSLNEQL